MKIEIISSGKTKTYRRLEKTEPEINYLQVYLRAIHSPHFLYGDSSKQPEDMEETQQAHGDYNSITDIENNFKIDEHSSIEEISTNEITEIISTIQDNSYDNEISQELLELQQKYPNQFGTKQIRKLHSKKALDTFCSQQETSIEKKYRDKVDFINTAYRNCYKTTFFDLRFRYNYSYKITEKQCSIKKSTRMTHPHWWKLRNKEKNAGVEYDDCVFIQDVMKHYLGNYHEFDIRSAVPRINAEMNGIHYKREVDIYEKIIRKAQDNDKSWAFCFEDYSKYRAQIKKLFMVFYFTGNIPNKVRYSTIERKNAEQEKKAEILRALAGDESLANELISKEVEMFDERIVALLKKQAPCKAFADAVTSVIGPTHHNVIFYIESLIELDTVYFFVSQGKMVINNYDGFFFEEKIDESEFQDVLDGYIEKHAMEFRNSIPAKKYAPRNIDKQMANMLRQPA